MSKKKHLFFVYSDFHYVICRNIILHNQLNNDDCFFVCRRGVSVESEDNVCSLLGDDRFSFWDRLLYLIRNRKEVLSFYKGYDIVVYMPFRFSFPNKLTVKSIVLYEEGFSAYRINRPHRKRGSALLRGMNDFLKNCFLKIVPYDLRGYLIMYRSCSPAPHNKTKMYVCSSGAYSNFSYPLINKEILPICKINNTSMTIPDGSYVLVLDRFSHVRIGSLDLYKQCVKKILNYCVANNIHEVWTKFHPADWNNPEALKQLEECNTDDHVIIHYFDGRLEVLALQNIGITFMGTNSTILYYAPQFGQSNTSVSFCRYLALLDPDYSAFLDDFGGLDKFVDVFSKYVNCLNFDK